MRQGLFLLQGGEKYFVEDSGVDSGACAPPMPRFSWWYKITVPVWCLPDWSALCSDPP